MLKIPQSDYEAMRKHGEECYPQECCGILLGRLESGTRVVNAHVRCRNGTKDTPTHSYDIPPEELVAAQKQARELGLDIIGFYHSHPDHPARWSHRDLEEAHWFACSYVITSVERGIASRTSSFVLCGNDEQTKRFDDENVEVLAEARK